jgi:hypothetical protein
MQPSASCRVELSMWSESRPSPCQTVRISLRRLGIVSKGFRIR